MPRIWSGNLTFSLVSIGVTVEPATSSHKIGFRQVHLKDMGRVRNRKVCELDEQPLELEDIGRAYEAPDGHLVEITDDELDAMPLPTLKTIEVNGFVDLAGVPPEQLGQPYFLAPSSPANNKPYALMRDALARSGKAAVGKLAMRGSERLALVHAREKVMVLQMLHWPDEIRRPAGAAPRRDVELSKDEMDGALALIDAMSGIRIEDFHDEYATAMEEVIEAKIEGAEPPKAPPAAAGTGGTVDLMAALRASLDQARTTSANTGTGKDAGVTHLRDRQPRKATTAKKPARKKTTPKKTTTKKSAGRGTHAG
ncbi:Ku protein [Streptomyces sp. HPF1205]|uniref:non-homologous end joining protein Ku n=1 Tax=Streptomyces sp. HPF1205 TaxID=2873262 RepID=UPI001CED88C8|nr:Ku protein [Streptomyces sp. HPF1205]